MSNTEFVHLHVHTDYSVLDGACAIYHDQKDKVDLIKLAHLYKMPAMAITDHGVMGGAIDFYEQLNKHAMKPLIGCELNISPTKYNDRNQNTPNIKGFHIVLLAKDFEGYQNLCKLDSIANLEGVYYKPRVDKELLAKYSKGLIALSACLKGELAINILAGKIKEAKHALRHYLDIFGRDNFYLELMDHGIAEQKKVNKELLLLAREFKVPVVATNDVHYLKKEYAKSHELLLCIQTNTTINDPKRLKFSSDEFYFKSGDEMLELFKEIPEAITNTLEVAGKCNLTIPFVPEVNHYPVYEVSKGKTQKEKLRGICLENLEDRYGFKYDGKKETLTAEQKVIIDRMEYELDVIDKEKYCSYFLVVWDFLKYAREQGIPVGPGRGSGAGSIVAYLSRITDIEPLKYQLLFERFLNPERVSPPDFDIDFCERRRNEVIEYVRSKYGSDSVAQIGTYGTLKAKNVIKDVGRVLGYSFDQRNMITKLMPNDPKLTLASSRENNEDINTLIKNEPWVEEIFKYSEPLEGLNRNTSTHAAGVIIGDQELAKLVPLAKGSGNEEIITQYPAAPCENLGLLKMDFLGLKTLTIIQDTVEIVKKTKGIDIDISKISLEDEKTYKLLNKGDTIAVFQLESPGMRDLCKRFGVSKIEDIIALIALYRPGPMQFIGDFIHRKTGREKVEHDHPKMVDVLKETYGIMLYQEQIMQVVQVLAGFTLGGADILRKAIGKKKAEVLVAQKKKFVDGCARHSSIPEEKANSIWDKIELFAGYGFNKAHSAAYAFLAYRTAYLKANFPVEFMCAVLNSEIGDAEEVAFFIKECREMEIKVLGPDVNVSNMDFTADGECIRFGLAAIKGVGEAASSAIIDTRNKGGKFRDIMDFSERAGIQLTLKVLEALTRTGALDVFKCKRAQLLQIIPDVIKIASHNVKDREAGQGSLFDMLGDSGEINDFSLDLKLPDIPELDEQNMLKDEKELLGFYVSGHPLEEYSKIIELYSTHNLAELKTLTNAKIRVGGIISDMEIKTAKRNGSKFAALHFEDTVGNIECIIFSNAYEQFKDLLVLNKPLFLDGYIETSDFEQGGKSSSKMTVHSVMTIEEVQQKFTEEIHIHLHEASTNIEMLKNIKELCMYSENKGDVSLIFCVTCGDGEKAFIEAKKDYNVAVSGTFLNQIRSLTGKDSVKLKPNKNLSNVKKREK